MPNIEYKKTYNKKVGDLGENLCVKYLQGMGYRIIEQNYRKIWAEIDIIAVLRGTVHFIEVKTVSYETKKQLNWAVTHETWRPEEQVHAHKLHQIGKGIETWLQETGYTGNWQIDVAAIRLVPRETYATVKLIENVILE